MIGSLPPLGGKNAFEFLSVGAGCSSVLSAHGRRPIFCPNASPARRQSYLRLPTSLELTRAKRAQAKYFSSPASIHFLQSLTSTVLVKHCHSNSASGCCSSRLHPLRRNCWSGGYRRAFGNFGRSAARSSPCLSAPCRRCRCPCNWRLTSSHFPLGPIAPC
jgi:hypothetical protein